MNTKTVSMNEADFEAPPPASAVVDMSISGGPTPNPGLDGKRIKPTNADSVYFVWKGGYKCVQT